VISPYYQDESVTIYHGKAEDVLPILDPVDLTVTSPPYDSLRAYNGYEFDFETIAKELYHVTKRGGVVVWVVADETVNGSESLTSFKQAIYFRELGFNVETMIYEAAGTGAKGSNFYYWQSFEYMFVLAKGQPKTSNRIADIRNTNAGKPRGFSSKSAANGSRMDRTTVIAPEFSVRPNVWRYAVGQNDPTPHPAPFPEALASDHIRSWSNSGDTILDPMMGSGTTGKMARKNGCKFIGIEISEQYCEIAAKRMSQEVLQFT
jgi:DNA modification methylase